MQNYNIQLSENTQKLYNYNCALNEMFGTLFDLMLTKEMTIQEQDDLYARINDLVSPLRDVVRQQLMKSIDDNVYTTNYTL